MAYTMCSSPMVQPSAPFNLSFHVQIDDLLKVNIFIAEKLMEKLFLLTVYINI